MHSISILFLCPFSSFDFCVLFRRLRGLGWGGNNVNWICTHTHIHMSCYATGRSLALPHAHTHTRAQCYATGCSLALAHTHTDTSCYTTGHFLFAFFALAHRRHATPLDILLHLHTDVMLRYWTFSCTCTQTSCYATGCSLALPHTHTSCYATGHSLDVMMGLCNAFSLSDISET